MQTKIKVYSLIFTDSQTRNWKPCYKTFIIVNTTRRVKRQVFGVGRLLLACLVSERSAQEIIKT